MERLHTTEARGYATYTCPECGRKIRTLADEYGDHGCICGWEPSNLRVSANMPTCPAVKLTK
jgi:hypothetical protein